MSALLAQRLGLFNATGRDGVPSTPHYAVIVFTKESVCIPGDERSRTNPGHGYPERTDTFSSFRYYHTTELGVVEKFVAALHEDERKRAIVGCEYKPYDYAIIHVDKKLGVQTKITLG